MLTFLAVLGTFSGHRDPSTANQLRVRESDSSLDCITTLARRE